MMMPNKRGSGGPLSPPILSLTEASAPRDNVFGHPSYHNGLSGNHSLAAATAANVVFPRSGQSSPAIGSQQQGSMGPPPPPPPASEKPQKPEKSKVKLFSRPGKIGIKSEPKEKPLPSPGKLGHAFSNLQRGNFSTTSLDSSAQSFYNHNNSSTATIRPADALPPVEKEGKEKEKKHHHFLSRQKHKLKDDYHLPLSSASSNSRPTDPNAPSSLYSFNLPSSPGSNTPSFAPSFKSGLDLRHGGRALRDKKKEEKNFDDAASSYTMGGEWPGPSSANSGSGPLGTSLYLNEPFDSTKFGLNNMTLDDAWPYLKAKLLVIFEAEDLRVPVEDLNRIVTMHIQYCLQRRSPNIIVEDLRELLQTGFSSLDQTLRQTPDDRLIPSLVDVWIFTFTNILPYMQAVFLPLDMEFAGHGALMTTDQAREFWGGITRIESPVETTSTVGSHARSPNVTPASSILEVRRLVLLAFRDIVILPRYETLKTMFSRLSLEFLPQSFASMALASPIPLPPPSSSYSLQHLHHQQNAYQAMASTSPGAESLHSLGIAYGLRPSTALSLDPAVASYTSTGTTLLGDIVLPNTTTTTTNNNNNNNNTGGSGSGSRSRAISNVSFGSDNTTSTRPYTPSSLHALGGAGINLGAAGGILAAAAAAAAAAGDRSGSGGSYRDQNVEDSKQVTEMVGRMLQCMSVLASVGVEGASSDESNNRMVEELNKLLKLNWLGRGRTGRNRRGIVGGRVRRGAAGPAVPSEVMMVREEEEEEGGER